MQRVRAAHGDTESALSAISIIELTHGVYRARTDADKARRKAFADELARDMIVHPVSLAIAQLAGRIEGEQAAKGISIAVEDLVIGATALHIGFDVITLNVKHFQAIPGLTVLTL
jgi:predicted nucleic acid-binding protein